MTEYALEMNHVSKSLGKKKSKRLVVDDASITIQEGEILALLGPNGAGKTTSAKMASTLLLPDSGEIRVCGIDAIKNPRKARSRLSLLLGGDRGFYLRMNARDNLSFFAALAGVPVNMIEQQVDSVLEKVKLAKRQHDRVETFSRGMRQRLHIARALLNNPGLILLDEPTTGLDPESSTVIRKLISNLRATGAGILLTTHTMREAEMLADRIVIMKEGRVIESGTLPQLLNSTHIETVTVFNSRNITERQLGLIESLQDVIMVNMTEKLGSWDIDVCWQSSPDITLSNAFDSLTYLGSRPASLEEMYLTILHQANR